MEIPSSRNGGRTKATSTVPSRRPATGWLRPAFESTSRTSGWRSPKRRTVSPTSGTIAVPDMPTRSVTRSARRAASSSAVAVSSASRMLRAWGSSRSPASVSATLRVLRSNSVTPTRRSSCRIWEESACWAMNSRSAARVKCSSSATATNARSSRVSRSTVIDRRTYNAGR